MTYEERLEAAERHRIKGNALFQEVRYRIVLLSSCMGAQAVENTVTAVLSELSCSLWLVL